MNLRQKPHKVESAEHLSAYIDASKKGSVKGVIYEAFKGNVEYTDRSIGRFSRGDDGSLTLKIYESNPGYLKTGSIIVTDELLSLESVAAVVMARKEIPAPTITHDSPAA